MKKIIYISMIMSLLPLLVIAQYNGGNGRGDHMLYFQMIPPTTQASDITFSSVTINSMNISWGNGDGEKRAVFMYQGSSGAAAPVDNTTYNPSATFGSGNQIGSSGWYCVYNSTGSSVSVNGLQQNTTYRVMVCEYNGTAGNEVYLTTTATGNPNNQATPPACANPTDGGEITGNQSICYGADPETISNSVLPAGHTGTLEYKWQKSTDSESSGFIDIIPSNSASYDPDVLYQTTWFKRLARVDCMVDWTGAAESNVATIIVQSNLPPVANAGGPYVVDLGDGVSLDGTQSYDPNSPCEFIVSYEWDIDNDGQYDDATGSAPFVPAVDIAFMAPGTVHIIGLKVTDSFGATDTDEAIITVYNNRPFAIFTASPNPAACNQSVTFNATSSYHGRPDRSIVSYEWDFDYVGGTFTTDATGQIVSHSFNSFGNYNVALKVTDNNVPARTDMATTVEAVNQGNQAPVADAGGPYECDLGNGLTLDGSGSSDPDEGCGDAIQEWKWELDNDGFFDDATGETVNLTAAEIDALGVGSHPVALRVKDSFGATEVDNTTLTSYDNRPFARFSENPNPACSGQWVQFDASSSYHGRPGKAITLYEWDFDYAGGIFTVDATGLIVNHPFALSDDYSVALRVTDDNLPPKTDMAVHLVVINPAPDFEIIVHAPQPVCGGALVEFSISAPSGTFTYEWDFDNAVPEGPTNGFTSKAIAPNTCSGTFTATCTVTDTDGDCSTTESVTITVGDGTVPEIVSPFTMRVDNDEGACGATISYDVHFDPGSDPFDGIITDNSHFAGNGPAGYPPESVLVRKPVITYSGDPKIIPPLEIGEEAEIGPFMIESFFDVYTEPAPLPPPPGSWDHASAPGTMTVKVTLIAESSDTRYYETEMVQLELTGGTLPSGIMLRESPILPSAGEMKIRELSTGGPYHIDSFFDVFTEISIDEGNNWIPASVPLHVSRFTNRTSPTVAYYDNCSAPAPVQTEGLPSGSLFPVGITVNTFELTDGCGNSNSTSFEVIVTDNTAPVIACPSGSPFNRTNTTGQCYYLPSGDEFNATASDNCPASLTLTYSLSGATEGTGSDLDGVPLNVGQTSVEWTASDGINSTGCSFIVHVNITQASNVVFSNLNSDRLTINWTDGSGSARAVFMKQTTTGTAEPLNNETYTPGTVFGAGEEIDASGWFCIWNGSGTHAGGVTVTNLTKLTDYRVMVCEYCGSPGFENYNISVATGNPANIKTILFSNQGTAGLPNVRSSDARWGDYDKDGDLDVAISGEGDGWPSRIYTNNGNGAFTQFSGASMTSCRHSSLGWGDCDNDNDLDLLLIGYIGGPPNIAKLYRNDNGISFTEVTGTGIVQSANGSVDWGDVDGDGDQDLLVCGDFGYSGIATRVYRNNGNYTFTDIGAGLTAIRNGCAKWGDCDNDGDLDVLVTGNTGSAGITKIFLNNGNNTFSELTGLGLIQLKQSAAEWGDYDNDGDLDFIICGEDNSEWGDQYTRLYRNNGNSTFTYAITFPGVYRGAVAWSDYNNDGYLDLTMTGSNGWQYISKLYRNNGNSTFTEESGILIFGVDDGSLAWGDYDNDGDADLLVTGDYDLGWYTRLYRNDLITGTPKTPNGAPNAPGGLTATIVGSNIQFSWNKSTDPETPQNGLSYNLYIGDSPGSVEIKQPMADVTNGYRRIATLGNTQMLNNWTWKNASCGTWYWGVQAVDNGLQGGEFAAGGSFDVDPNDPVATLTFNPANPSCNQPVTFDASSSYHSCPNRNIISYEWDFDYATGDFTVDATGASVTSAFNSMGNYTVAVRVIDNNVPAKSNIAETIIAIIDVEPPAILCPSNISVNNDAGECSAVVNYAVMTDPLSFPDDCWLPFNGKLADNGTIVFPERARDVMIRDLVLMPELSPFICNNLPDAVGSAFNFTDNDCDSFFDIWVELSLDWTPVDASGIFSVTGTLTSATAETRYFETEMVQLNLSGDAAGLPVLIRESPTLASTGTIVVTQIGGGGGGGYQIDSFFDIWTELSLDGGQSWTPATEVSHVNQFTNLSGPSVVYHDNCGAVIEMIEGLPSGSSFPVGTTTNTFKVTDAAGNMTTGSFDVTVTDSEAPEIICPEDQEVFVNCLTNNYTIQGNEFDLLSYQDNCGTVTSIINSYNGLSSLAGAILPPGNTTITWLAYDDMTPPNVSSCSFDVTVHQYAIAGTLKYNNAAKTPMNNVELTISPAGTNATSTTDGSGNYSFTGLCPGVYTITVTDINKPVGYINSTDASAVNAWNANQVPIEHVKWMAGDVNQSYSAQSTDAKAIQNWFVYFGNPEYDFDRGEWAFMTAGDLVASNFDPNRLNDAITLTVDGLETLDLYGQAVGDFNGSFVPGNLKAASSTLGLVYGETRLAGTMAEVELPVRVMNSEIVSAASLILDYPEELLEVKDVSLKLENGNLDWFAEGGELRIGWNSLTPLWLEANSLWLTIHGRTADSFGPGDEIRVTLAPDPLNELADGSNNVIPDAQLEIDVLAFSTTGTNNNVAIEQFNTLSLLAIPNPFAGYSKLEYRLPIDGHVTLEISDMMGRRVALLVDELQTAGEYSMKLDATPLQPGVYMATLRLETSDGDIVKTIKLVRER